MKWLSWIGALTIALTTGCSIGGHHAYHTVVPSVQPAESGAEVAVAVHDRRDEVLTGDKQPDFVGLLRGGYGNPFDVTTASDAPLASDMAQSLQHGLALAGYRVKLVPISPSMTPEQATAALVASGAPRLLLLRFVEWKSDTYGRTALIYDIEALAMNERGQVLAQTRRDGRDNLGGSFWNPGKHARRVVLDAYRGKLEHMLGEPQLRDALAPRKAQKPTASRGVPRS